MFSSMITGAADRFDTHFFGAYWLPAFVAAIGCLGIVAGRVGPGTVGTWVSDRNSVQETLIALILVVAITMLAFMLQALRLTIVHLYSGVGFPRGMVVRSSEEGANPGRASDVAANRARHALRSEVGVQPTRFGSVLAAAAEHARLVYGMDGVVWWARLMPLLPTDYRKLLSAAQAPTMAMLNLSAVLAMLGIGGSLVLAFGHQAWAAVAVLAAGLILSRLAYVAAVGQVSEFARLLQVAFDLYRHEILNQMGIQLPKDLASERVAWQRLTDEIVIGEAPSSPEGTTASHEATADPARSTVA